MFEQGKFFSRQFHAIPVADHTHVSKIDAQTSVLIFWSGFLFRPAEHCPNAGDDLLDRKRFDNIVVRARFEAQDLVALGRLGGQHDYRRIFGERLAPKPPAQLHPAHSRQHQVEDHKRRRCLFIKRETQALFTRFGDNRTKTLTLQVILQTLGDVRIILDDQNCLLHSVIQL